MVLRLASSVETSLWWSVYFVVLFFPWGGGNIKLILMCRRVDTSRHGGYRTTSSTNDSLYVAFLVPYLSWLPVLLTNEWSCLFHLPTASLYLLSWVHVLSPSAILVQCCFEMYWKKPMFSFTGLCSDDITPFFTTGFLLRTWASLGISCFPTLALESGIEVEPKRWKMSNILELELGNWPGLCQRVALTNCFVQLKTFILIITIGKCINRKWTWGPSILGIKL